MLTILTEKGNQKVAKGDQVTDNLWIPIDQLEPITGWTYKPEGLCKGDFCIPKPKQTESEYLQQNKINVSPFWEKMNWPILHNENKDTWVLGESAELRSQALESLKAPNFTLPDLDGKMHSLSDYLGKKVFLVTWASW